MIGQTTCLCCRAGVSFNYPRVCPECDHVFQGNGWDGIDAHWRANHETVMRYGSSGHRFAITIARARQMVLRLLAFSVLT